MTMSNFVDRHMGPREADIQTMLDALGYKNLDDLTKAVVPKSILDDSELALAPAANEHEALQELKSLASQNLVLKNLIGQGYYNTHVPAVIQRNVFENPVWYTAYTPYQPEISQGRLEVLFYYQTMVTELTGMDIANASLLDEATAAAEAMTLAHRQAKGHKSTLLVSGLCHPQTIELLNTRSEPLGIKLAYFDENDRTTPEWDDVFGLIVQYPSTDGRILDHTKLFSAAHEHQVVTIVASDLLALTLLKSPGQIGADVVIGNSQRFGVPLGFGGPHAGFFAVKDNLKRTMPGRLVGESIDATGKPAYRLALQTREQHIRREKATSNICTAQALLAVMATLYAAYHGPDGLIAIAKNVHSKLAQLKHALGKAGFDIVGEHHFDTVSFASGKHTDALLRAAVAAGFNLRKLDDAHLSISLDETTSATDLQQLAAALNLEKELKFTDKTHELPKGLLRTDTFLSQKVFHQYRSETEMMRYLKRLSNKDITLDQAMIPLGSCTMKLNAAVEMMPVSWPEFNSIHPFAPPEQWQGYREMIDQLEAMLCACTGYAAVSLQPNAGSQGEYAGLLAIRQYHIAQGDTQRTICLIPESAHGTNPASAQMVDMQVVVVACDEAGNVDLADLDRRIAEHQDAIAAIMITYPSTHGVFEEHVSQVCGKVHDAGGQVYIDGANLNAMVGVAKPGHFGGDVSHLNLHKTFCIPHGGGGPGVGPIAVAEHLADFLPQDGLNENRTGALISGAPFGSASILPISWMYIRMMGAAGLKKATQVAILNANYIAYKLKDAYPVLYTGNKGLVAHECIIDTRPMKADGDVSVDDIAKRLIDFGFHAPTMSFPVPGTLMIEPTESESLEELERFCRAMLIIHSEYLAVKKGELPDDDNPLCNAPHTLESILDWKHAYSIRQAINPDQQVDPADKYWPPVARIDNVYGDRNLVCSCPPMSDYE
ncbi:MAG: aminomethyl-transferring glycine dehydrogenase [Proteobacteria bacterium]|jgi:glycine dehydrogenase|nr:aminomethyl-transferring glycine dehydrogenase [Pseudomonadota bacterium]